MEQMQIKLDVTLGEVNVVLTALGQLPYVQSAELITKIRNQAVPQAQEVAAVETPSE